MTAEPLLSDSCDKLRDALELVFASAANYKPFAPGRLYAPQEREPFPPQKHRRCSRFSEGWQTAPLAGFSLHTRCVRHRFLDFDPEAVDRHWLARPHVERSGLGPTQIWCQAPHLL